MRRPWTHPAAKFVAPIRLHRSAPRDNRLALLLQNSPQFGKATFATQIPYTVNLATTATTIWPGTVNLQDFSLTAVLKEVSHWMKEGVSLFAKQWQTMQ